LFQQNRYFSRNKGSAVALLLCRIGP
jgi:hypothetical protein